MDSESTSLKLDQATQQKIAQAAETVDPQLWLITAAAGSARGGLVATFVTKASIVAECPRFVIGLAKQHHTWKLIEESNCCVLHLIRAEQSDWVMQLGATTGHRQSDKLAGLELMTLTTGAPVLVEALVAFDCRVEARLDSGDRTIYLLAVVDALKNETEEHALRVSELFARLPEAKADLLAEQMGHDQQVDRAAIEHWRKQKDVR